MKVGGPFIFFVLLLRMIISPVAASDTIMGKLYNFAHLEKKKQDEHKQLRSSLKIIFEGVDSKTFPKKFLSKKAKTGRMEGWIQSLTLKSGSDSEKKNFEEAKELVGKLTELKIPLAKISIQKRQNLKTVPLFEDLLEYVKNEFQNNKMGAYSHLVDMIEIFNFAHEIAQRAAADPQLSKDDLEKLDRLGHFLDTFIAAHSEYSQNATFHKKGLIG